MAPTEETMSAQHRVIYDDETGALEFPEAERRKLHLNRGINIDVILMIIVMSAGFTVWLMGQSDRVTVNTQDIKKNSADIEEVKQRNKDQDMEADRRQDQILSMLSEQNKKLDQMLLNQRRSR